MQKDELFAMILVLLCNSLTQILNSEWSNQIKCCGQCTLWLTAFAILLSAYLYSVSAVSVICSNSQMLCMVLLFWILESNRATSKLTYVFYNISLSPQATHTKCKIFHRKQYISPQKPDCKHPCINVPSHLHKRDGTSRAEYPFKSRNPQI